MNILSLEALENACYGRLEPVTLNGKKYLVEINSWYKNGEHYQPASKIKHEGKYYKFFFEQFLHNDTIVFAGEHTTKTNYSDSIWVLSSVIVDGEFSTNITEYAEDEFHYYEFHAVLLTQIVEQSENGNSTVLLLSKEKPEFGNIFIEEPDPTNAEYIEVEEFISTHQEYNLQDFSSKVLSDTLSVTNVIMYTEDFGCSDEDSV